jgi:hypothetical protein
MLPPVSKGNPILVVVALAACMCRDRSSLPSTASKAASHRRRRKKDDSVLSVATLFPADEALGMSTHDGNVECVVPTPES